MELPSLDLNLVVVLNALLQERNVTRAGERVGLSQPATSAALGRLRRHFNDPILERVGSRYLLTPLAQGLADHVGSTLRELERVLAVQPHFDPSTAEKRFLIRCSDAVLTILGPGIVAAVGRVAPRVELDFRTVESNVADDPLAALLSVDVMILPRGIFAAGSIPHTDLYKDRWICAASRENRSVGDTLTLVEAAEVRWIMPYQAIRMVSPADAALTALGIDRHGTVRVESFAVLARLVRGTELLVLLHSRLAQGLASHDLREVQLPVTLPPLTEVAWWHPDKRLDPGHRWLVEIIVGAAAELAPEPVANHSDPDG